jgi:hypothetical protein
VIVATKIAGIATIIKYIISVLNWFTLFHAPDVFMSFLLFHSIDSCRPWISLRLDPIDSDRGL